LFGGHAPPFGWYCSASRSRASAPSSSATCVTSPVAPGWFVESSPRSSASLKQRPPAARTTVPASMTCSPHTARQPCSRSSSERSGLFASAVAVLASKASRSAFVIAWPVRSPTWSRRFRDAPPQRARRRPLPRRLLLRLERRQPLEAARQVPVPVAQELHRGRQEHRAHDRGIEEDGDRESESELLHRQEPDAREQREHAHHHERSARDR